MRSVKFADDFGSEYTGSEIPGFGEKINSCEAGKYGGEQQQEIQALTATLKAQAAQIQKVSDQITPRVVAKN
jgi:hypothetical protein